MTHEVVGLESFADVFVVDADGKVYSFGANTSGQLGLGDRSERVLPTVLTNFKLT